jgi:hypothetical protein
MMHSSCRIVTEKIMAVTDANPGSKELGITERVAEELKRNKTGMFQSEVDYRIIFPGFVTPSDLPARSVRLRADLAGFSSGKLVLMEYKLYDERIRTSSPWKVLFYLLRDRLKLESVITANRDCLPGFVIQACAVKNTDFQEGEEQTRIMSDGFVDPRAKSIRNARYYPILPAFAAYSKRESPVAWSFEIARSGSTAYLFGVASLQVVK